ncbi:MAG: hypothetical protein LBI77_03105 [Puniceicoccales bacterium]|jgi:hypothetical protein|nr:hypothetical protein [Puniceicoccales bacterium]
MININEKNILSVMVFVFLSISLLWAFYYICNAMDKNLDFGEDECYNVKKWK